MRDLAVCIIAKNEASYLERCIRAFRDNGMNPSFFVLDNMSSDSTVEAAKNLGCFVTLYPKKANDFAALRNAGLDECYHDSLGFKWLMTIDADEIVTPALAEEIKRFVSSSKAWTSYDAAWIHNTFYERDCYTSKVMLVKWPLQLKYKFRVHEEFDLSSIDPKRVAAIYGPLIHDRVEDTVENMALKNARYAAIAEKFAEENKDSFFAQSIACIQKYYAAGLRQDPKFSFDKIAEDLESLIRSGYSMRDFETRYLMLDLVVYNDIYPDNKQDKKISLCLETMKHMPPHPIVCMLLAKAFYSLKSWSNSIFWFNEVSRSESNFERQDLFKVSYKFLHIEPLEYLIAAYYNNGEEKKSLEVYKALKAVDPDNGLVQSERNLRWFEERKILLEI